jgi:CheY-like chemotaxis protein/DNA-binding transcriptional ArsR family regulator
MAEINVMIVEDELITAEAIAILLRKLKYNPVAIVSSGEEAISKLKDLDLDLILMDIILAGTMDGIEAAQFINSNYNIPIIFITAYGDKKTLDRAKLSEPYWYIVKPITNEDDLLPTIELAMYNHQVKNELKKGHDKFEQIRQLIQPTDSKFPLEDSISLELSINELDSKSIGQIFGNESILVDWLKSCSNPDRFLILEILKSQPLKLDDIQIIIGKSQSTSSHHVKKLEESGFIRGWKNGKYTYYSLNKPKIMENAQIWENWLKNLST